MPHAIDKTIDLTHMMMMGRLGDGLDCLLNGGDRTLPRHRPHQDQRCQVGQKNILGEGPIRAALMDYAWRVIITGFVVSLISGILVFVSLYFVMVRPMRRITRSMVSFHDKSGETPRASSAPARVKMRSVEPSASWRRCSVIFTASCSRRPGLPRWARPSRGYSTICATSCPPRSWHPIIWRIASRIRSSSGLRRAWSPRSIVPCRSRRIRCATVGRTSVRRNGQISSLAPLVSEAADAAIDARIAPVCITFDNQIDANLNVRWETRRQRKRTRLYYERSSSARRSDQCIDRTEFMRDPSMVTRSPSSAYWLRGNGGKLPFAVQ